MFVDESREAVSIVKENLAKCRFTAKVVQTDSIGYLRGAGKFDMIFLDPPYNKGYGEKLLPLLGLLKDGTFDYLSLWSGKTFYAILIIVIASV